MPHFLTALEATASDLPLLPGSTPAPQLYVFKNIHNKELRLSFHAEKKKKQNLKTTKSMSLSISRDKERSVF